MRRRNAAGSLRPYGSFGYAGAFDWGYRAPVVFGDDYPPKPYTLDELERAWEAYRERHMEWRRGRAWEDVTPWAVLVFEEGLDPDLARATVARHLSPAEAP